MVKLFQQANRPILSHEDCYDEDGNLQGGIWKEADELLPARIRQTHYWNCVRYLIAMGLSPTSEKGFTTMLKSGVFKTHEQLRKEIKTNVVGGPLQEILNKIV